MLRCHSVAAAVLVVEMPEPNVFEIESVYVDFRILYDVCYLYGTQFAPEGHTVAVVVRFDYWERSEDLLHFEERLLGR